MKKSYILKQLVEIKNLLAEVLSDSELTDLINLVDEDKIKRLKVIDEKLRNLKSYLEN